MGEELAVNGVVYRVGDPAPPPLPLRSEAEVMARWQGDKPIVSIRCATYQHVGFIEDALRGFLGQNTDFPFEILVRDDASTDGTAEIVRDYAQRYPNIIRAVLETENRYPEVKPGQVLGPMARGEFIALCEGDDYWIAPDHLARAVTALAKDLTLSASVGKCFIISDGTVDGYEVAKARDWNWYLPVRALVYRSTLQVPTIASVYGDNILALQIQRSGTLRIFDEFVAVYRRHPGGLVAGHSLDDLRSPQAASCVSIAMYLARTGDLGLAIWYQEHAIQKIAWMLLPYGVSPLSPSSDATSLIGRVIRLARRVKQIVRRIRWGPMHRS